LLKKNVEYQGHLRLKVKGRKSCEDSIQGILNTKGVNMFVLSEVVYKEI